MKNSFALLVLGGCMVLSNLAGFAAAADPQPLQLHARFRSAVKESPDKGGQPDAFVASAKTLSWQPAKTALVVVDMWDDHWCRGAAERVAEMAPAMNKLIAEARSRGIFVVHCPSTTVDFYKDTPQRQRARQAPFASPPIKLSTDERWGTAWCWPDRAREGTFPIDDSDMGCDCAQKCKIREAWSRQIATIDIAEADAITDNGQELYNLFAERGIDNVVILGVHLNMCVLGRPFAIRQLVHLGKNVVLVRDLTDTMYNHEMEPKVDHFTGTDLVVEHIEKYWCPSISSTDLVGGRPFRFAADTRGVDRAKKSP